MDYTWITERVATGAAIDSVDDITTLVNDGVTHIIDMRAEFDDNTLGDTRVQILWLPQEDDGGVRPPGQYPKGVGFALRAMGIPKQEAINRIHTLRPSVTFDNFSAYIQSVEQQLRFQS